ncbi:hypothetical protein [Shimazuella soli]|uniref:hypothetical protein n=1 Tax=Shimazuella soli TaxID=1892854 RepID=UPI001F112322|nr:hypothetical protein [Shimazuella soli]
MWKKGLFLIGCLLLISGCAQNNIADNRKVAPTKASAQDDKEIKHKLMDLMDNLMDHHDRNIGDQRQMVNDYNTANQLGSEISQSLNQGGKMSEAQYNQLMSSLDIANSDLNIYKQGVLSLLNEIPTVESKANELQNEGTKLRATQYLAALKRATQFQVDYINNFKNLIDSYRQAYVTISQGQQPNTFQYDEYSKKEGELIDNFNKEIDEFNAAWKTLNEKDFNREVKENLSF